MTIRIVIVDDHPLLLVGLRRLLSRQPEFELVGEATDAAQALALVGEARPDLVLMDVRLPGLDGVEATRRVRAICATTRVVGLSGQPDAFTARRMLDAGADGFLGKEEPVEHLLEAIRIVAGGRRYTSPAIEAGASEPLLEPAPGQTLTPREREVLQLLTEGLSIKESAARLECSPKTIEAHRKHLMEKLGIHTHAGLVKYALRAGLTGLDR